MKTKISLTNSKLSGQIPSVNLPAIKTCRADAPCKHLCYATKGNFKYPNVEKSHLENLAHFVADKDAYFNDIIEFLSGLVSYKYFRFHSSGDIVNDDYFLGMIKVAKKCKNIKFHILLLPLHPYHLHNDNKCLTSSERALVPDPTGRKASM